MELLQRFRLWYYTQPPALRAVLTINVVLFLVWHLVVKHFGVLNIFVFEHFVLNTTFPDVVFQPWQILTYSFLHLGGGLNGVLHIVFNMLWLVWVGREFEYNDGSSRFLSVVLLGAIGGAIAAIIWSSLTAPNLVYGASASVFAILAAVATLYPMRSIGLMFIGNIRLPHLVIGALVLDVVFRLFDPGSNTSISAHMGGALTGFLIAKGEQRGLDLHTWAGVFFPSKKRQKQHVGRTSGGTPMQRLENWLGNRKRSKERGPATIHTLPVQKRDEEPRAAPKNKNEQDLDRLLDKINEHGIDSLTKEERSFLDNESRK